MTGPGAGEPAGVGFAERLAVHAGVAALGGVVLWGGLSLQGASSYFPLAVGAALVALSAVSAAACVRRRLPTEEAPLGKGLAGLALLTLFVWLAGVIGFLTGALLFIPAMAVLGGDRRWVRMAIGSVAFVILAYVMLHVLLGQPFPPDLLFGE